MVKQVGDLELEQDLKFEKKEWTAQRLGRAMMGLIVVAALLGLFGGGPLSLTEVKHPDGDFSLTYERFGRRGTTSNLIVEIDPKTVSGGEATLWLSTAYLDNLRLENVHPMPDEVSITPTGYLYTFLVEQEDASLVVTLDLTIDAMGVKKVAVGIDQNNPMNITHFFMP